MNLIDVGVSNSSAGLIRVNSANTIRGQLTNPQGGVVHITGGPLRLIEHPQTQNAGIIRIGPDIDGSLELLSDFTLRGGGTVEIGTNLRRGYITGTESAAGAEMFLNQDNVIRGAGIIGSAANPLRMLNRGVISAPHPSRELLLSPYTDLNTPFINSGVLSAASTGVLAITLSGSSDAERRLQNYDSSQSGKLRAELNGAIRLTNVFVDGGTIETLNAASNVTCASNVTLQPAAINLLGYISNSGNLRLETALQTGPLAALVNNAPGITTIDAGTTITGSGLSINNLGGTIIVQPTATAMLKYVSTESGATTEFRTSSIGSDFSGSGVVRVSPGVTVSLYTAYETNFVLDPGATIRLRDDPARSVTAQITRLSAFTIPGGASWDLGTQAVVRDRASGTTDPTVLALLQSGCAGGAWNGPGINTSANTDRHAIGFATSSNLFTSFPRTWLGQSIDSTTTLLRYTLKGDANLDGDVDFDDLLALAQSYGATSRLWYQGDSNYDGAVNFDDLLSLSQNYGGVVLENGSTILNAEIYTQFASDWLLARSFVPEPATMAFVLGLTVMSVRHRRNGCNEEGAGVY